MNRLSRLATLTILLAATGLTGAAAQADSPLPAPAMAPQPSYADLADLADGTPLVVRAQIRKAAALEPERARGVRPGWIRAYVEARTEAVIGGSRALGEQLSYLVDVKADAKGKLPSLKKKSVILFARPVTGRPAELQLVAPDAQIPWDLPTDARVKTVLGQLYAAGAAPRITGVREALYVPGNLAGAGETQVFLGSASGEPAAITVTRMPGADPVMTASFSEVVGSTDGLPAPGTLAWYRLACFLPAQLPGAANIGESAEARAAAARDYRAVIERLGACPRTRR